MLLDSISSTEAFTTEHKIGLQKLCCRVTTEKLFSFLHSPICPRFTKDIFTSHLDQKSLKGLRITYSFLFGITASGNIRQMIQAFSPCKLPLNHKVIAIARLHSIHVYLKHLITMFEVAIKTVSITFHRQICLNQSTQYHIP